MASNKGTLDVAGPYELTELRVFDAGLREVASGVKHLHVELDPGIYRVRARVPGDRLERLVEIEPGQTSTISGAAFQGLRLESPVPLPTSRSHHEYHEGVATALSKQAIAHVTFALPGQPATARLFLFARTRGRDDPRTAPPEFSLRARTGEPLARFPGAGAYNLDDGWLALLVDLPTGTYSLVQETPGMGPRAQAVFVEGGWETHVFAPWRAIPDFSAASHFIRRRGTGFDPNAPWEFDRTEAALDGLVRGRVVIDPDELQMLLYGKFENPMLGLIGAYAVLGQRMPAWSATVPGGSAAEPATPQQLAHKAGSVNLSEVAGNLRMLLPHSPDALLITLLAESLANGQWPPPRPANGWPRFDAPPLLAAGTEYVLRLAAEVEEVCPADSWLAEIAVSLTTGSPWTRWQPGTDQAAELKGLGATAKRLIEQNARRESTRGQPGAKYPPASDVTEELHPAPEAPPLDEEAIGGSGDRAQAEVTRIARELGLPSSLVSKALGRSEGRSGGAR